MISHEKKIVFVHIPKTGGKSFSRFLAPYCEDLKFSPYDGGDLHATMAQYMEHYGEERLKDYTFVSIIRNPWDKALSLAMHQLKGTFDRECFRKVIFEPTAHELWPHSHLAFWVKPHIVRQLKDDGMIIENMRSQFNLRGARQVLDTVSFPTLIRFENYAQESAKFFDKHGIKYDEEDLRKKTNATPHKHYSHYYQQDEIDAIGVLLWFRHTVSRIFV